jgi:hypothetical protein
MLFIKENNHTKNSRRYITAEASTEGSKTKKKKNLFLPIENNAMGSLENFKMKKQNIGHISF